ncbi:MAG: DeoR family transcriptional regulator [Marivirga sp.]|nr:DeoR family transcriptional regulator [Marivirga sp.]
MLKQTRHDYILAEVRIRNRVLLADIATHLNVSEDTIRRDLKELDKLGQLRKVHGGAVAKSFYPFIYRKEDIYDHPNKLVIAKKAAALIEPGQVVLISGGTTNLELATELPETLAATFFTPSLLVATQLAQHSHIEAILIGGKVSHEAQIALGADAINTLSQIRADVCFLGTGHLDPAHGLSEFDWEVVQLKKAMIRAAKRIVSLTLSAKLNSSQRYQVCPIQNIHTLITELPPDNELLLPYKKVGLEII